MALGFRRESAYNLIQEALVMALRGLFRSAHLLEQVVFFCGSAVLFVLFVQLVVLCPCLPTSNGRFQGGVLVTATVLPPGPPHILNSLFDMRLLPSGKFVSMWRFLREVFCRYVAHNLGYITRIGHGIHSSELLLNFGPESGNSGVTVWVFSLCEPHDLRYVDFRLKLSWLMVHVIEEGERSNNGRVNPPP